MRMPRTGDFGQLREQLRVVIDQRNALDRSANLSTPAAAIHLNAALAVDLIRVYSCPISTLEMGHRHGHHDGNSCTYASCRTPRQHREWDKSTAPAEESGGAPSRASDRGGDRAAAQAREPA